MKFIKPLYEKKPKGAPDFHHSDAPDAEGRFRDLGIKDLAAWLIKTRKKDVKKISGSLTQQVVFNRNDDPEYAEKMEKVRKEVYKQLGRQDLLDKMDEAVESVDEKKVWILLNPGKGYVRKIAVNDYTKRQKQAAKWKDIKSATKAGKEFTKYHGVDVIVQAIDEAINEKKKLPKEIKNHKDIPSWARYVAQHSDGEWTWYEETPTMIRFRSGGGAWKQDGNQTYTGVKTDGKDWDKIPTYYYVKNGKISESVLNEEDSYNDYPAAAKKNAQMAIDWKEKYGRDEVPAGTPVGWARAHQLAKGEKISAETVKRMSAFNRHRKNSKIAPEHKDTPWKDNGYVAWLIWGGDAGVDWAMEKSKEIDAIEEVKEGKLSVKAFVGPEAGGPSYKKFGLRLKKLGSSIYGGDDVEISGSDSKLLQFAKASLGVGNKAKNVRDAQKEIDGMLEAKQMKYIKPLNEGYWSHYEYDKWTKENGKPKYPKWVKTTLKEIVKGGFMEDHYDAEHNYMVLWLASLENKRRSELLAYDNRGKKEFGKVGYAMYQRFYNDLTGYNMFFMQGALYAMEVSKQIQDRIANGEPVEPAYYMMKEYFNNFGMDTNRSRVFNAAYEKLEKWMKDNQIETL